MSTAHVSAPAAVEEPVSWPRLEPERVPQSVDWTDRPRRAGAIKPADTARRAGAASDADPRTRQPAVPLTPLARGWMRDLPLKLRPGLTAQQHPHVVNRLSAAWTDGQALQTTFNELFLSGRLGRKGFSLDVLGELLALQTYHAEPRRR